ncbi:metal-dependent transcriptional regulator [Niabella soli]|uniref:metal-dependent transcriptional regulator n=1 Tax=Niabella soli TaxID=446683 RepID=UPI00024998D5|nr:metal-dependent transcriptional regulator [Niabella soli]
MTLNITSTEQNYIKAIYHLERNGRPVNTNDLATQLATTPASVTDMIKKLKQKKLINYKAYYGCTLTESGRKQSLLIIRRHRLWEYFLSKKLGFNWDAIHEIAEELEHVSNTELINKLDAFLGYPEVDPHGDPIPDANGNIATTEHTVLGGGSLGKRYVVAQIGSQLPAVLELLDQKHIKIGTVIEIKKRFDFDQSLEIKTGNKQLTQISKELAQHILVKEHE